MFRGARSLFSACHAQPLPAECSLHLATARDLLPSAPHAVQIALSKFYTLARQGRLIKNGKDEALSESRPVEQSVRNMEAGGSWMGERGVKGWPHRL